MTAADTRGLRQRVIEGERAFGVFLSLGSRPAAFICGQAGLDWALIDLEHGSGSESTLAGELDAIKLGGTSAIVRVESNDRLRCGKALDLGAEGIMVPRIEGPDDARAAILNLRFPPQGRRGVAVMTPAAGFGRLAVADLIDHDETLAIVQIESEPSVSGADAIAAIDGVDVLFVGPADLSSALGQPGQLDHPTFRDALAAVVRATDAHGKAAGILLRSVQEVPAYLELGFRFIGIGSEAGHLANGMQVIGRSVAELRHN